MSHTVEYVIYWDNADDRNKYGIFLSIRIILFYLDKYFSNK